MDFENVIKRTERVLQRIKRMQTSAASSKTILQEYKRRQKNCVWHGLIIRKLSTGCHTAG
jgi:hypothetical protein